MLTIVMIDDDATILDTVKDVIADAFQGSSFHTFTDFDKGKEALIALRPDLVIVDWFEGPSSDPEPSGRNLWDELWQGWFCPVVFYSAYAEKVEEDQTVVTDHPFVRTVGKGLDSTKLLCAALTEFRPHALAVRTVAAELDKARHAVLRDVASAVFKTTLNDEQKQTTLARAMRRRLAASMDDAQLTGSSPIEPWEMFLFPPITEHLLTGDILFKAGEKETSESAYRLVLTPSCDLVKHGEKCKVTDVLVAKCDPGGRFLYQGIRPWSGIEDDDLEALIGSALNESQRAGLVLLPSCPTRWPMLVADLKKTALIPIEQIGQPDDADAVFHRIGSIDSPFREYFVTWSFMQICGRPGIPPRAMTGIVEEFAEKWRQKVSKGKSKDSSTKTSKKDKKAAQ